MGGWLIEPLENDDATALSDVIGAAQPPPQRRLSVLARPIVWCDASDPVRDVARRIGDGRHSCAVIRTPAGLGIVTDHDFRGRVATGEVDIDAPVSVLATVPVLTIEEDAVESAALLRMVEHAVHHLVLTDRQGDPLGVVRAVDLAGAAVRDPLMVRSAVEAATSLESVREAALSLPAAIVALSDGGFAASYIGAVHAAVVEAIVRRVLRLRAYSAPVRHSWVVLGSLARRESLPLSDVDTALVWDDPPPGTPDPADSLRAEARRVLDDLRRCGLEPCPSGTNADNPTFSRSSTAWSRAITSWQRDYDGGQALLMTSMVADSRPLTEPWLGRCLADAIGTRNTRFLRGLLDDALGFRPPTGFVHDFVVEHSGHHSGELDVKKGGLAPIAALARWVAVCAGEARGNTTQRLRLGAELGILTDDEAQALTVAFEYVYAMLLRHEALALKEGRTPTTFVRPADLDTLTRRHLRDVFRAIRTIQSHVDDDWMARVDSASRGGLAGGT